MTIKFPDSIYFDDTLEYSPRFSGGCELWKSSDTLHTHEVIPQPGIHTIDNLKMFNENHGVAFIVFAEKNKEQTAAAFAETFDGGKTWTVIDSSRQRGNYQASSGLSHDSASYIMYESHFTSKGVPNKIYLWKNNGKERTTITVPTDHSHLFPISADTLFYSVPGELYRMILSPATSVEEPKVEDYETSVFLQSPYPNPASATMKIPVWYYAATVKPEDISVKCYDITGAKVADLSRSITRVSDGQLMAEWDMSDIPSGVYIVKSSSTNRRGNTRIVVKAERK
jgi:hypothetical protein